MRAASLALLTLVLVGCPKKVDTTRVAGTDDEQLATYEARLEELRSRGAGAETSCDDRCSQATQTCDVSEDFCEVVARHPERPDLTRRCVQAQESCAETTDSCSRCRAR